MENQLYLLLVAFRKLSSAAHTILDEIIELTYNQCFKITYSDQKCFFINRHSVRYLRDFLLNPTDGSQMTDYIKDYLFNPLSEFTVTKLDRRNYEGSHFGYINLSHHDLSRYQIYQRDQIPNHKHCLLYALSQCGIDTSTIRNFVINRYIDMTHLKLVADKLQINIHLHMMKNRVTRYPKNSCYTQTVHLALYQQHYFVYEHDNLNLIHNLFTQGQFEQSSDLNILQHAKDISVKLLMHEQQLFSIKPKKDRVYNISYADIECITKPFHKPFLYARYTDKNYKVFEESGNYAGFKSFLNSFEHKYNIVYFHNLKYDWSVLKLCPHIKIQSILKKDHLYYQVIFMYYDKKFELRDSYKLIPKKLSDFSCTFDIDTTKHHYLIYDLYTEVNCYTSKDYVDYRDFDDDCKNYEGIYHITNLGYTKVDYPDSQKSYIVIDNRLVIEQSILKVCGNYFISGRYYHLAHARYYIHQDCLLLKLGMEKFRTLMIKMLTVDCHQELTLPSMIHRRVCLNGYYDGVYELKDNLREFVKLSVHGGRVCTKWNGMWKVEGVIQVIDANSMYPASIQRICIEGGFPVGEAKLLNHFDPAVFYYVVKIKIITVGKHQQIPFLSYLTEDGHRHYTNEMVDKIVVIDKITLEDWVKFHQISYEFVEGIYWNNGGNDKMKDFIEYLYHERMNANVSINQICKLILNSLYGKTIVKTYDTKIVIKDHDKVNAYVQKHFERLISQERCGNQSVLTVINHTLGHANMTHIGGMILSMARRMMNEVMDVANDQNIHVLYQDTDAIHVVDALGDEGGKLQLLSNAYYQKYNKILMGDQLGQFSNDLEFDGHGNVHSSKCIILGKKAYIHCIQGVDKEGVLKEYYYPVLSGINSYAMSEFTDKWQLYERLYDGEKVQFDLAHGDAVMFEFKQTVTTRETFLKHLQFDGDKYSLK